MGTQYYDAGGNLVSDPSQAFYAIDPSGNFVDLSGGAATAGISSVDTSTSTTGSSTSIASFGTLFSNIATGIASIYKTVTGPNVNVINPRTGQPYTQAQLTQLAQQNAVLAGGSLQTSGLLPVLLIGGLVLILLMRK